MPGQSSAQIMGRQGERWFQSVLPPEWLFTRPSEDFGVDGTVSIGTGACVTPVEFGVQVQASKSWAFENGCIVVPGVAVPTLRYWAARLLPTLLVLYDPLKMNGYFAWTMDLVSRRELEGAANKSIRLKVPDSNLLDSACWSQINRQAVAYHHQLASAFASLSNSAPFLRTTKALASALQALSLPPNVTMNKKHDKMLHDLASVAAHRKVVSSLRNLASKIDPKTALFNGLLEAADDYRAMCADFIDRFDDLLLYQDRALAVWIAEDRMDRAKPAVMFKITGLISSLTSLAMKEP